MAAGDPACDLVIAWTFLKNESRRTFKERIILDSNTWARARGWALWKACFELSNINDKTSQEALRHQQIIDAVINDTSLIMKIKIRNYREEDAQAIASLYYNTIHNINCRDYSEKQINAWAPYDSVKDYKGWQEKLAKIKPFVAVIGDKIVGFAEFEATGHIDCFYVHHEYQSQGIGSALMKAIMDKAAKENIKRIYAEVSITAKPFFERQDFKLVKAQTVNLRGVELNNFVMERHLANLTFELATENQANLLVDFEQTIAVPRLYSKPLDLPGAIKEIRENNYYFIMRDGKLVGTAAYAKQDDGSCYISNMAVGPEYRGQGIARAAMEFLLEKCKDSWRVHLVTHPENFRSIPLYESFGFVTKTRIEDFYGDGEPRILMAKMLYGLRFSACSNDIEWQASKIYRQKYFFDNVPIEDPYTWTFTHKDHKHFVLYNGTEIIGYAHIILWPENRAAMRIIVIDTDKRGQGFGKWFMQKIEAWVKDLGFHSMHLESRPDSLDFYTKLGYTPMPFNEPDGDECGPPDIAVGKIFGSAEEICINYDKIIDWFDNARTKTLMEKEYLDLCLKHLKPGAHILDLGCGTGEPIAKFFIENGMKITGIDGSPRMVALCKQRFPEMKWQVSDMRGIDLNQKFDAIIAWDSFFHLPRQDQRKMFSIFKAHIAPGGILVFTTGIEDGEIYGTMDGQSFYHSSLGLEEYRQLLAEHGFTVLLHKIEDPDCGEHTVWVAKYKN